MIPKPFFSQDDPNLRTVGWWLMAVAALVFIMILVGGATRLTGSGLSMVDWQPISGALPPISAEDWQAEFTAYQQYPEYQQLNQDMTLEEFKGIFWWEYAHRLLGRLIGLAFALPLLFFLWKRMIPPELKIRMFFLLALGAAQGLLGWYMVQSGLGTTPAVSHLRLLAHLTLAMVLLSALLWTAWQMLKAPVLSQAKTKTRWLTPVVGTVMVLIALQLALGALTAGLGAGQIYNHWPLMGTGFIPGDLFGISPFYDDPTTVQFFHRLLGYLIFFVGDIPVVLALVQKRAGCLLGLGLGLTILIAVQVFLGVFTLVHGVPAHLGVAHQGLGIALFLYCLYFMFALEGEQNEQNFA